MSGPALPPIPPDRRRNARVALAVIGLLLLAYPALFFGWYLTADHVTVRITSCPSDAPNPLRCPTRGEWTMADGTLGSGRIYIQTPKPSDVGRVVPARASKGFAVAEGVTASPPSSPASMVCS